jgi:glyoxylase-like metal-dependent hydrolase (beta-lactamase superfamily II)
MNNLITLSHRSTHAYLLDCRGGKLLVDPGWPGTLAILKAGLKRYQVEPAAIKYVFATHLHPDHAGLAQEVKNACGSHLIIHSRQLPFLDALRQSFEKKGGYLPIKVEPSDLILDSPARAALESIGVKGALLETPGHSDDSISLVLDNGAAFVGDLTWPDRVGAENSEAVIASWRGLIANGARIIYPGHGGPIPVAQVRRLLPDA